MFQLFWKSKPILLVSAAVLLILNLILFISWTSLRGMPVVAAAPSATPLPTPSPEQFLPPQKIALSPFVKDVESRDLNKDGYDDLATSNWSERTLLINGTGLLPQQFTLSVMLNNGGDKKLDELPQFTFSSLQPVLEDRLNALRLKLGVSPNDEDAWINHLKQGGMLLKDFNGDGYEDLLAWSAPAAQLYVYWNQKGLGRTGPIFVDAPKNSDQTKQITIDSVMPEWGMPIFCTAGDFDGDGKIDIVVYNANVVQKDSPLNKRGAAVWTQVESLWLIFGKDSADKTKAPYEFDAQKQLADLGLPYVTPVGVITPGVKLFWHSQYGLAPELMPITGSVFWDAPSNLVMTADGIHANDQVASHIMNAGRVMQVESRRAETGRDALWFAGTKYLYRLIYDDALHLFKPVREIENVDGRSNGMDLVGLGDGSLALALKGGKELRYGPLQTGGMPVQSQPRDYFKKMGAYVQSVNLGGGQAAISTLHYQRPGENEHYRNFSYSARERGQRMGNDSLLLLEYIREKDESGIRQIEPLFEGVDRKVFQALTIKASLDQKPVVTVGRYGRKDEQAIAVLEDDHLLLYRPNDGSVPVIAPQIYRLQTASNFLMGLVDSGSVLLQGDIALIEGNFPATDPLRYMVVEEGTKVKAVLPVSQPVTIAGKQMLSIPGLRELPTGDAYYIEGFSSGASTGKMKVKIVEPFAVERTNQDRRANRICGIRESSIPGKMFPSEFRLQMNSAFKADKLELVRLFRMSDGISIDLKVAAGEVKVEGSEIVFSIPASIGNGNYRVHIYGDGYWRVAMQRLWTVSDEAICSNQVKVANDQTPAQGDGASLYLDKIVVDGQTYLSGEVEFLGKGFWYGDVQSVRLKQSDGKEVWTEAQRFIYGDRWLGVNWGDLSTAGLDDGKPVTVEFYAATQAEAKIEGAPPIGTLKDWRTVKKGRSSSFPKPNILKADPGALEPGKTVMISGDGLVYHGIRTIKPVLTLSDGSRYVLPSSVFSYPDEWFTTKQSNTSTSTRLLLKLPALNELGAYKVTSSGGGTIRAGKESDVRSTLERGAMSSIAIPFPSVPTGGGVLGNLGLVGLGIYAGYEVGYQLGQWYAMSTRGIPVPVPVPVPVPTDKPREEILWAACTAYLSPLAKKACSDLDYFIIRATPDQAYAVAQKAVSVISGVPRSNVSFWGYSHPDTWAVISSVIPLNDLNIIELVVGDIRGSIYPSEATVDHQFLTDPVLTDNGVSIEEQIKLRRQYYYGIIPMVRIDRTNRPPIPIVFLRDATFVTLP